jgi:hypothetical protein
VYLAFLPIDVTWWVGTLVTLPLVVVSIWGLVKLTAITTTVPVPASGRKYMRRGPMAVSR